MYSKKALQKSENIDRLITYRKIKNTTKTWQDCVNSTLFTTFDTSIRL